MVDVNLPSRLVVVAFASHAKDDGGGMSMEEVDYHE
jgi:hypothetical protein